LSLDKYQQAAVDSKSKKKAIIAPPGGGKTTTLTHIIKKDIERGIDPSSMVAITFTRLASKELNERLDKLIGEDVAKIHTSTIHAFCLDILDDHIEELGWEEEFNLYDRDDKKDIIVSIIKKMQKKITYTTFEKTVAEDPDDEEIKLILGEYREKLQMYNSFDLEMILTLTIELLTDNEEVLKMVREKYNSLYVDEFQDTSELQLKIINLINPEYIVVIGDLNQSIYEWNNARPDILLNIEKTFEGIDVYKLVNNYRSTHEIVDTANKVIKNNIKQFDVEMIAHKEGIDPDINYFDDEAAELEYVFNNLQKPYSNNAIIVRTNKRAEMATKFLTHREVPVNLISSAADIFKKSEIKNFLKLMQLVHNPYDDYSYLRSINWPVQRIKPKEKQEIEKLGISTTQSFYDVSKKLNNADLNRFNADLDKLHDAIPNTSIYSLLVQIRDTFNVLATYDEQNRNTRIAEFEMFRKEVKRWGIIQGYMRRPVTLTAFLRYVKLRDVQENLRKGREAVNIMTLHACKGLEFENVFMLGLNESEFPSGRSKNMEEERRLFYVGITRAKTGLHFCRSSVKQVNKAYTQRVEPSRFLFETGHITDEQVKMGW